jgi:hypothetical protein
MLSTNALNTSDSYWLRGENGIEILECAICGRLGLSTWFDSPRPPTPHKTAKRSDSSGLLFYLLVLFRILSCPRPHVLTAFVDRMVQSASRRRRFSLGFVPFPIFSPAREPKKMWCTTHFFCARCTGKLMFSYTSHRYVVEL